LTTDSISFSVYLQSVMAVGTRLIPLAKS
jgi:hypothetical protein